MTDYKKKEWNQIPGLVTAERERGMGAGSTNEGADGGVTLRERRGRYTVAVESE